MSWLVWSLIATFHKQRDFWTISTIPNVETFPVTEGTPLKVKETFSKWTRFIGWEEICESRPEAKVPHLFHHWKWGPQQDVKTTGFCIPALPDLKTIQSGKLHIQSSVYTALVSGFLRHRSISWCPRRSTDFVWVVSQFSSATFQLCGPGFLGCKMRDEPSDAQRSHGWGPEFGTQIICAGLNSAPLLTGRVTRQGANPFYALRGRTLSPARNQVSLWRWDSSRMWTPH